VIGSNSSEEVDQNLPCGIKPLLVNLEAAAFSRAAPTTPELLGEPIHHSDRLHFIFGHMDSALV
jgi:hypothetical protein